MGELAESRVGLAAPTVGATPLRFVRALEQRRRRVCGRQGVARLPVDEDLGDGPVEQDHELPGESGRLAKSVSGENFFQPSLEAPLVTRSDHAGRMTWQICELGRCAQEAAATPARILGVLPKLFEDSTDSARRRRLAP